MVNHLGGVERQESYSGQSTKRNGPSTITAEYGIYGFDRVVGNLYFSDSKAGVFGNGVWLSPDCVRFASGNELRSSELEDMAGGFYTYATAYDKNNNKLLELASPARPCGA